MRNDDHTSLNSATILKTFSDRYVLVPPIIITLVLIASSQANFLLFHTLAEFFAIMVAILVFVVTWQTARFSKNDFLMFLACGYLWIGTLDTLHTLGYKGMNVFSQSGANLSTQFWISTRYCEAMLLLAAPLFLSHRFNKWIGLFAFGVVAFLISALIATGNFPDTYIEGSGLTSFKINSEYAIIAILFGALIYLYQRRVLVSSEIMILLAGAIILTMIAELAFTYYVSVYGLSNIVGHIFKIFSYWLLFVAITRTSLIGPYRKLEVEISERKKAENTLSQSEERHRIAMKLANIEFWRWSFDEKKLTHWSDNFERQLSYGDIGIPQNYQEMIAPIHPDDQERVLQTYLDSDHNRCDFTTEYRIISAEGGIRYLIEIAEVEYNEQGKAIAHIGIVQDITNRKNAENQLIQYSKLASLGEMATGIAHEINQPLNAIQLSSDTLEDLSDSGDIKPNLLKKHVGQITSQIQRATEIINHIRTFGRMASKHMHSVSLVDVVESSTSFLKEQFKLNSIEILVVTPEHCRPINGNDIQLEQVIINLLNNARDAIESNRSKSTGQDRTDSIKLQIIDDVSTDFIQLTVSDTGGGVGDKAIDHVFEPFFTTKDIGKGTGLGLSITYGLINDMGGTISVANENDGAIFTISLPVLESKQNNLAPSGHH